MLFRKKEKIFDPKKSASLEAKGDEHISRQEYKKAIKSYRQAAEADPENSTLYEKMLNAQSHIEESEWSEEEFLETLSWTMKKQEIEHPELKEVHETLTPEYAEIRNLIAQMLMTPPELREPLLAKIKSFGIKAVLPLINTLLTIDSLARQNLDSSQESEPPPSPFEDPKGGNTL
jgi:tetratricopeptide (TPR) repeat protein